MSNNKYIGKIINAGLLDEFIASAKAISNDMNEKGFGYFEFEKRVISSQPIENGYQQAVAACEVFKIATTKYFNSDFGTWQREYIGKWGIWN